MGTGLPRGIRLAVDLGRVRVGVARSDPEGLLAVPVTTLPRDARFLDAIVELAVEWEACSLVVGWPLTLAGEEGPAAREAAATARRLAARAPCPVYLLDERLTTREADRSLRAAGRSSRNSRPVIDQAAAVVLLEQALARERADGTPPGRRVTVEAVTAEDHDGPGDVREGRSAP